MEQENLVNKMNLHLQDLAGRQGEYMVMSLGRAFTEMADNQRIVSSSVPGCIPGDGELPSKDALRTDVLAIIVEMTEFLQELDWKAWKHGKKIDREKVAEEFADVLAFTGILFVYLEHLGIPEGVLAEAYRRKSIINVQRFLGQHGSAYQQTDPQGWLPTLEEKKE